jgi:hypothetical protein
MYILQYVIFTHQKTWVKQLQVSWSWTIIQICYKIYNKIYYKMYYKVHHKIYNKVCCKIYYDIYIKIYYKKIKCKWTIIQVCMQRVKFISAKEELGGGISI